MNFGFADSTNQTSIIFHDEVGTTSSFSLNETEFEKIRDLNYIEFYVALRELYLTDGFALSNKLNSVILGQKVIPDLIYQLAIRALELTRFEMKQGDASLKRIKGMIKVNEPDALIHQPWLIDLADEILRNSFNSRDVAYSIRDLGVELSKPNFTRTDYTNGTYLRQKINNWTAVQGFNETNFTESFLMIHHTIGPENFGVLADILEAMPWQVLKMQYEGMYLGDAELLRLYKSRLNSAIADADITSTMLKQDLAALVEVLNSTNSLIGQLADADIIPDPHVFSDIQQGIIQLDGEPEQNRNQRAKETMENIWASISNQEAKNRFISARNNAMNRGIGGLEGVKLAMTAGARLIKNLGGSVDNANRKCQELVKLSRFDSMAQQKILNAVQILLKLNGTDGQNTGYQLLFDLYFDKKAPRNQFLFSSSRYQSRETMIAFFGDVNLDVQSGFPDLIKALAKEKPRYEKFHNFVDSLQGDNNIIRSIRRAYGINVPSMEFALKIRTALQSIRNITSTQVELVETLRSIREIYRTDYSGEYFTSLASIAKLSRDEIWLDVYDSLENIYTLTVGPVERAEERVAPFRGLKEMIGKNGSYLEVFLAMQSILESPWTSSQKCEFIKEYYSGLEDVTPVVEAFGIKTDDIRRYNEGSTYIDALIQLLRASGSLQNLGRLLAFHKIQTTDKDPNNSIRMIADLLIHFGKNPRQ
ncbi:hypothetical protein GCK72_010779 [Caenorhabditis remanei]|uniref:Uncharacterized protein n=1 Tax=Caenorhabditis remanei TaxID=31234 RepID=A0A6A5H5Q1_CAERE|nr:hypothetical protein GCK72_010779 [Caenorhabditis remanei]KAF1762517.1 hypothetical protein GCK72_010779 [Caenorhabditis remanei]